MENSYQNDDGSNGIGPEQVERIRRQTEFWDMKSTGGDGEAIFKRLMTSLREIEKLDVVN